MINSVLKCMFKCRNFDYINQNSDLVCGIVTCVGSIIALCAFLDILFCYCYVCHTTYAVQWFAI